MAEERTRHILVPNMRYCNELRTMPTRISPCPRKRVNNTSVGVVTKAIHPIKDPCRVR